MPASLTYSSLVTDVVGYCERPNDADLLAQLPRLIMLAENRLATDLKLQGFIKVVTGNFTLNDPTLPKPSYWKDTVGFNYVDANGARQPLFPRLYEFCSQFWPTRTKYGNPRYYADYDAQHYFVVPVPVSAFSFELSHHVRLDPIDAGNQTNWITDNVPQLLLAGTMKEAQLYLRNDVGIARWEQTYQDSKGGLDTENAGHLIDRTSVPTK